jgi:NADP-dependent 3-hydroxy acid dehydrogenase YdfG
MGNAIRSNGTSYSQQVLVREDIKSSGDPIYKKGGVYLIIGGAGGIGELLTEHLLEKYQAKVVWLGRRELSKAIAERLDRLALSGPMPMYLQGDATSLEDMQKVHQAIISEYGEVNGVIHSAMVLDDATLATMSQNSLNQVLQAKVDTSVNMAHVFSEELLDFVLFFSSVNSFYKAPGQSNYVAGCCFTDVLSDILRQRMSCKIKVVNWGYWGTIGAVAELRYQKGMEKMGFASIDPDLAMSFLDRFMQSDNSVGCYVSVANDSVNLGLPIIDDSVDQLQDESPDSGNMLSDIPTLIKGDKHEVVSLLRSYILRNAASALYLEASELDSQATPFEDVVLSNYGLDSLLSSNLRYQILKDTEVDLPVQMFIGDKISQIIDELYQQLLLNHVSSGQEQQDSEEFEQFVF